ncbi:NPCBM/NEW2 domain-containing protein [Kitasatospora indigofera]|uniref:NPCBM/NEW2 domain-containing protein n=1 Tax=Kitasatospora indigofera TaxID=67307 RepID=UPI00364D5122
MAAQRPGLVHHRGDAPGGRRNPGDPLLHLSAEDRARQRRTVRSGTSCPKGPGIPANSGITCFLGGTCTSLTAVVGIDDAVGNNGKVTFEALRTVSRSPTAAP